MRLRENGRYWRKCKFVIYLARTSKDVAVATAQAQSETSPVPGAIPGETTSPY